MPEYSVDIQHTEGNDNRVAVTGTVNGRPVAATVMRGDLPVSDAMYQEGVADEYSWPARAKKVLAGALVDAYEAKGADSRPHAGLISVTRE